MIKEQEAVMPTAEVCRKHGLCLMANTSISGARVARELDALLNEEIWPAAGFVDTEIRCL
ncbi:MAG: hypothetical protein AAGF88_02880 [Pseudomonadota bacterium]